MTAEPEFSGFISLSPPLFLSMIADYCDSVIFALQGFIVINIRGEFKDTVIDILGSRRIGASQLGHTDQGLHWWAGLNKLS